VPVYEVYKVGATPYWAPGMDLLAELGLRAAVIPHYDNAEGGTSQVPFIHYGACTADAVSSAEGPGVLGIVMVALRMGGSTGRDLLPDLQVPR
ncbi:MAG: hypothetical protein ACRDR6_26125, partial [Pseudonocardiaceae bacterium]